MAAGQPVTVKVPEVIATCSEGANPRQDKVTLDPASPLAGERTQVALAGLATVKVADAALPLWRPLAWKVSLRPGIVEPAKPLGTANEAATWPPAVAFAEASTVAPKVTSTRSEGAKPRQERVTRAPAGPLAGDRAQLALAEVARVAVVVSTDPSLARVVGWVVGAEDAGAAVLSALREVQPVTARATTTAVAIIRTGRMVTLPKQARPRPVGPGQQPRLGRSQHGHRWASRHARTGLCSVAVIHPTKHAAPCWCVAGGQQQPPLRNRR